MVNLIGIRIGIMITYMYFRLVLRLEWDLIIRGAIIRIPMIRILTIRIMIGITIQKAVGYAYFLSYWLAKSARRFKNVPARFSLTVITLNWDSLLIHCET